MVLENVADSVPQMGKVHLLAAMIIKTFQDFGKFSWTL